MSICLQSIVEEILIKREGKRFRCEGFNIRYNTSPNFSLSSKEDASSVLNGHSSEDGSINRDDDSISDKKDTESDNNSSLGGTTSSADGDSSSVRYSRLMANNVFDDIREEDL